MSITSGGICYALRTNKNLRKIDIEKSLQRFGMLWFLCTNKFGNIHKNVFSFSENLCQFGKMFVEFGNGLNHSQNSTNIFYSVKAQVGKASLGFCGSVPAVKMLKYVLHLVELNFAFTHNPKFPFFADML